MEAGFILTSLGVLATILGVFFLVLAFVEYRKLAKLRENFLDIRKEIQDDMERVQRAMQLVISSYAIPDGARKIQLLEKAVSLCPDIFNGYNALGYAHLELDQPMKAIASFSKAVQNRPADKAGYFDLAAAYLKIGEKDLALRNLEQAVKIDPSSREDLSGNALFKDIEEEIRLHIPLQ